jgi:outer membrane protein TolC
MMFGFSSVSAQQQVSLQEAIKQALQNKAEAKKAALQVKKAEYKIDEARAGALPQISASINNTYNPILQKSVLPGEFWDAGTDDSRCFWNEMAICEFCKPLSEHF